jgi:hypothetical protein
MKARFISYLTGITYNLLKKSEDHENKQHSSWDRIKNMYCETSCPLFLQAAHVGTELPDLPHCLSMISVGRGKSVVYGYKPNVQP